MSTKKETKSPGGAQSGAEFDRRFHEWMQACPLPPGIESNSAMVKRTIEMELSISEWNYVGIIAKCKGWTIDETVSNIIGDDLHVYDYANTRCDPEREKVRAHYESALPLKAPQPKTRLPGAREEDAYFAWLQSGPERLPGIVNAPVSINTNVAPDIGQWFQIYVASKAYKKPIQQVISDAIDDCEEFRGRTVKEAA